ncbi:hypothetical protein B0H16DRAFT_1585442 [Mycena metata]|uniref:Uncharacterized protein n=1 Tax=Mycena metata TaxID=1033252 RepID=A0AAD7HSA7_9AGAR|nr:hypothetical protein B0H16DRAFT_1593054 [Mycena metata]KAJ7730119.1 hypothetical protein B0H16DRAFT_1585442 [Mycena metata]
MVFSASQIRLFGPWDPHNTQISGNPALVNLGRCPKREERRISAFCVRPAPSSPFGAESSVLHMRNRYLPPAAPAVDIPAPSRARSVRRCTARRRTPNCADALLRPAIPRGSPRRIHSPRLRHPSTIGMLCARVRDPAVWLRFFAFFYVRLAGLSRRGHSWPPSHAPYCVNVVDPQRTRLRGCILQRAGAAYAGYNPSAPAHPCRLRHHLPWAAVHGNGRS